MDNVCVVILAAGDGKRMKSKKPKVLCEVLFRPMLSWVLDACAGAEITELCTVVSPESDDVRRVLPVNSFTAVQVERLGTGHAVMAASDFLLKNTERSVLLLYGDTPFVDSETIRAAYACHRAEGNDVTVVTAQLCDPTGYGRIVRSGKNLKGIVEHRDASAEELKISEINSGIYWFKCSFLLDALQNLSPANAQGEYYITDTVAIAIESGHKTGTYSAHADTVLGANDRAALAALNETARRRVIQKHYENGVNIPFTDGVIISPEVVVGMDTTILPGTILKGGTVIGAHCTVGPNTTLDGCKIGDGAEVTYTVAEEAQIGAGSKIGPYTRLRPKTIIGPRAKVGNFVEIKNSNIGEKTSVAHLTYLGDSDVGDGVNIGCGVVTANYDGEKKHRTIIGSGAFVCCNTNLIAPIEVGEGSTVAAGTTVTENVPAYALAIGRARQINKDGWSKQNGKYKRK